jgi:Tetratricopeptide repeat
VYREEASMRAVERWLGGDKQAMQSIQAAPAQYKPELIAMLGYYQSKAAGDDVTRRQALSIMQLAEPFFDHPQLKLGMAEAELALGDSTAARTRLEKLLAAKPDNEDAKKMLAKLATP